MALQVINPEPLVRECKKALGEVLHSSKLGFSPHYVSGNGIVYELLGEGVSKAEAKYPYHVLPFITSEGGLFYWLAVTLEFQFLRGIYNFQEACFLVFEGMVGDNVKQGLLRAEWSSRDETTDHAQPHWHIYPSYIYKNVIPFFEETEQVVDFTPERPKQDEQKKEYEWQEGMRFHFAMSSRWHVNGIGANKESLTVEGLAKWLQGVIAYTRDQLLYLESKR